MSKMDEIILVAPRMLVFENESLHFQGTLTDEKLVKQIIENIHYSYYPERRGDAEEDITTKQPIPYIIIRREDEIYVYERLNGGGETRLHNKLSLGVGGHMNTFPGVEPFEELIELNLYRELEEELYIQSTIKPELKLIGLLNDDEDEVGLVHIGILGSLNVHKETNVQVRETEQLRGFWLKLSELKEKSTYDRLENWSKIVVDIL